jgi:hypothetical protein
VNCIICWCLHKSLNKQTKYKHRIPYARLFGRVLTSRGGKILSCIVRQTDGYQNLYYARSVCRTIKDSYKLPAVSHPPPSKFPFLFLLDSHTLTTSGFYDPHETTDSCCICTLRRYVRVYSFLLLFSLSTVLFITFYSAVDCYRFGHSHALFCCSVSFQSVPLVALQTTTRCFLFPDCGVSLRNDLFGTVVMVAL